MIMNSNVHPISQATSNPENLPLRDSAKYHELCDEALAKAAEKYAWIAQCEGIVLRRNPLGAPAYKHWVFDRLCKAEFSFAYWHNGKRLWAPDLETLFGEAVDGTSEGQGIVIAEKLGFQPGQPEVAYDKDGCRILNLWQAPKWVIKPTADEPKAFIEHVRYLVDGDEISLAHLLDFFAHLVQRPNERPAHAILITSAAKGIGKSTLGKVLCNLVGERNSRVAQTKDLKGQFDGWLMGKLLIQVDEIYEAGNWDLANKLKPLITEERVSVNVKYGPQTETDNFARFLMFSNHPAPLSIEEGDRRYFVVNSKAQPRTPAYYQTLNEYVSSPRGMTEIYTYLSLRNLDGFNPYAPPPLTNAKEEMIKNSGNPLYTYISEAVRSGHFRQCFQGGRFSHDQIVRQLQRDGFGSHAKNTRELHEGLKRAGITKAREKINGDKRRVYHLPNTDEYDGSDDF